MIAAMTTLDFDDAQARGLLAVYSTPDVVEQRTRTLRALLPRPAERLLDIGSGPGLLARDMAKTVGEQGRVTGLDASEAMLALARDQCDGLGQTEFVAGDATSLPFDDGVFDGVTCTQVYEYVEDVDTALHELARVVRPGGRAVIVDSDYDSWVVHTRDAERFAKIRRAWDDHFVHRDLPRILAPALRQVGFTVVQVEIIPMLNTDYHPHTYSYGMIDFITRFCAGHRLVGAEMAEAWRADLRALGAEGRFFFSLNRYQFLAIKQS